MLPDGVALSDRRGGCPGFLRGNGRPAFGRGAAPGLEPSAWGSAVCPSICEGRGIVLDARAWPGGQRAQEHHAPLRSGCGLGDNGKAAGGTSAGGHRGDPAVEMLPLRSASTWRCPPGFSVSRGHQAQCPLCTPVGGGPWDVSGKGCPGHQPPEGRAAQQATSANDTASHAERAVQVTPESPRGCPPTGDA